MVRLIFTFILETVSTEMDALVMDYRTHFAWFRIRLAQKFLSSQRSHCMFYLCNISSAPSVWED